MGSGLQSQSLSSTVLLHCSCTRKGKLMKALKFMGYWPRSINPPRAEKINKMKILGCLRKFSSASSVIRLFSQICHHVKSAESKNIKGMTHNVKKFSLAAHFLEIRIQRVRENEPTYKRSKMWNDKIMLV